MQTTESTFKSATPTLNTTPSRQMTLVIGGNGKTGRRVVERLEHLGFPLRIGSRSSSPAFDWTQRSTWEDAVRGAKAIYITYHPDLACPGASDAIRDLMDVARMNGVEKLVLLSGRGEPEAQICEGIVMNSGIPATVVRASWFHQNFSENFLRDMVMEGTIALPAGEVVEPFVDADDIADVAVAALTEDGHAGEVYEVTGPELLSFADVAQRLSSAIGREIAFQSIPHEAFMDGLREIDLPEDLVSLLDYLFAHVLDGRNAYLADGVQRALDRDPKSFAEFAKETAATGAWNS